MQATYTQTANPSPETANAQVMGMNLHNYASQLEARGDLAGAEKAFLEALRVKGLGFGSKHLSIGISYNSLGEVYAQMGKLDLAEESYRKALEIRIYTGPAFDAAVTRENLAQLFERRGEFKDAREIRVSGGDHVACSNYTVSIRKLTWHTSSTSFQCPKQHTLTLEQLQQCAQCGVSDY